MQMAKLGVKGVYLDSQVAEEVGDLEFTIDCGAVYFGAVYDNDGNLLAVDQYFYTENSSHDDLNDAVSSCDLLCIDDRDFPVKSYLLTKNINGNEWLRYHAVVPQQVNPDYFYNKYLGE